VTWKVTVIEPADEDIVLVVDEWQEAVDFVKKYPELARRYKVDNEPDAWQFPHAHVVVRVEEVFPTEADEKVVHDLLQWLPWDSQREEESDRMFADFAIFMGWLDPEWERPLASEAAQALAYRQFRDKYKFIIEATGLHY
jgi:hypothetical protein